MAVIKVRLLSATGGATAAGPSYNVKYWVEVNDKNDGPQTVMNAVGWHYGDTYIMGNDLDTLARCSDIQADPVSDDNFTDWMVDVKFGVIQDRDASSYTNPIADPVEEAWGFTNRAEDVAVDLNGLPYMNTAGELIEHQRSTNYPLRTFIRNEISVNQSMILAVKDAVNLTAWKGFAAKTVKVTSITNELRFNKTATISGSYVASTYNFEVNPDTWRFRPLNAGLNHKAPDLTGAIVLQSINLATGPVDRPVPLKLDGSSMRNSAGTLTGTPFLLDFMDYPELEFNTIFAGL